MKEVQRVLNKIYRQCYFGNTGTKIAEYDDTEKILLRLNGRIKTKKDKLLIEAAKILFQDDFEAYCDDGIHKISIDNPLKMGKLYDIYRKIKGLK